MVLRIVLPSAKPYIHMMVFQIKFHPIVAYGKREVVKIDFSRLGKESNQPGGVRMSHGKGDNPTGGAEYQRIDPGMKT